MKILSEGIKSCIPPILDADKKLRDWIEWSDSFNSVLTQEKISLVFKDENDTPFNDIIDSFFKVEININNFLVESKAITYSRWNKAVKDLDEVKDTA